MNPMQIKLAAAGAIALLAWLLSSRSSPARVKRELEIEADVYSPNFGLTQSEIDARKNPAVDPDMRDLIDISNALIAQD